MQIQPFYPRNAWVTFFILLVAAARIAINMNGQLHPMSNFSPIGAMALFGGACFSRRSMALLLPLFTLFISDAVLAATVYSKYSHGLLYSGWYWVYGAFALMVLAGRAMIKTISVKNILIASLMITFIHWIVTDLGVWINGTTYAHTMSGWINCLEMAIPFKRNFLAGTLLYGALLFGGFVLISGQHRLRTAKATG